MITRSFYRQLRTSITLRNDNNNKSSSPILSDLLENAATFEDVKPTIPQDVWSTLPYPEGAVINRRDQSKKGWRPKTDPKDTTIILFPGQGSQYVGMAKDLLKFPAARHIFELANTVLNYDLLKICLEGPKSELDKTVYCQPAVMVSSLAALERLKEERPAAIDNCVATAGFSLGEITALVFAGSLPFDKALKLVQIRGEAMQLAAEQNVGGMASVLYTPESDLNKACKDAKEWCIECGVEYPECRIANYLYPHCKVIAGSAEAINYLEKNAKKYKLKRVRRLPVNGAFHTDLMLPAVEVFTKALRKITIEDPIITVHSNVDGKPYRNASHILGQLPKQIYRPVKWEQTLHIIYERAQEEDFPRTFECGPGRGLTTILRQVNAKAADSAFNIEA